MNSAGCRSNVAKVRCSFGWKAAAVMSIVAAAVIAVIGLMSIPLSGAAPYGGHAAYGVETESSLESSHTLVDSDAPLNLVVAEAYIGDAYPVVTQTPPAQPTYSNAGGTYSLTSGWGSGVVELNSSSPIVAGHIYGTAGPPDQTFGSVNVTTGGNSCGGGSGTAIDVDQFVVVGGIVQTLALQFDCFAGPII